ncbi:YunC family protein [Alicyclobacillus dauci]|uniref:DUF1805 domain-containing protein n=1 Tax=Alicyclobacillus dauci TaxID=1475485 RepID=A0ABY6YZI8_9BACL|nr:DUF1805 domain-containing protein [Alicyclobacillus dauci]WAH35728.1 DUF1805 domain-containing protein [Alicyclobacillus dauci]
MVKIEPIWIDGYAFTTTHVALPKTNLLMVSNSVGYVMCGALDVGLLRDKLASRGIIAARATGVKTMEELIQGNVESCTQEAEAIGITVGMSMTDALKRIGEAERRALRGAE